MNMLVLSLLLILVLLYPLFWIVYTLRRIYGLRFRGFWVARKGRDEMVYEERRGGETQRLTLSFEMCVGGSHLLYIPNEEEWAKEMPDWARDRRLEIMENVKRALGTKNFEYHWS